MYRLRIKGTHSVLCTFQTWLKINAVSQIEVCIMCEGGMCCPMRRISISRQLLYGLYFRTRYFNRFLGCARHIFLLGLSPVCVADSSSPLFICVTLWYRLYLHMTRARFQTIGVRPTVVSHGQPSEGYGTVRLLSSNSREKSELISIAGTRLLVHPPGNIWWRWGG